MTKIIQLDVDGVLRDFTTSTYQTLRKEYPSDTPKEPPYQSTWDIQVSYPKFNKPELYELIFNKLSEDIFLNNALSFPGAAQFVQSLKKRNYTVIINTHQNYKNTLYTLQWLHREDIHFDGFFATDDLEKNIISQGILIDDKIENVSEGDILVSQPWNIERQSPAFRVNKDFDGVNYQEILDKIDEVYPK